MRILASLMPRELEITRPLEELSDAELGELIEQVRSEVPAEPEPEPEVENTKPSGTLIN